MNNDPMEVDEIAGQPVPSNSFQKNYKDRYHFNL